MWVRGRIMRPPGTKSIAFSPTRLLARRKGARARGPGQGGHGEGGRGATGRGEGSGGRGLRAVVRLTVNLPTQHWTTTGAREHPCLSLSKGTASFPEAEPGDAMNRVTLWSRDSKTSRLCGLRREGARSADEEALLPSETSCQKR